MLQIVDLTMISCIVATANCAEVSWHLKDLGALSAYPGGVGRRQSRPPQECDPSTPWVTPPPSYQGYNKLRITYVMPSDASRTISQQDARKAMARAAAIWAKAIPINFEEITEGTPDFTVHWRPFTCTSPPPYIAMGCANPSNMWLNDRDFDWFYSPEEQSQDKKRNLLFTTLHELGHVLGLQHSCTADNLMYPTSIERFSIDAETVRRIHDFYGALYPDDYEVEKSVAASIIDIDVESSPANGENPFANANSNRWYFCNKPMASCMTPPEPVLCKCPVPKQLAQYSKPWEIVILSETPWTIQIKPAEDGSLCLAVDGNGQTTLADCSEDDSAQQWLATRHNGFVSFQNEATNLYLGAYCVAGGVCVHAPTGMEFAYARAYLSWILVDDTASLGSPFILGR